MIKSIHTSCKSCIFAKYERNTQIDCVLKKLDLMKKNNIAVLEAYDEEKEFNIINGVKCLSYRNDNWLYTTENLDKQKIELDKEIQTKFHAIIFFNDDLSLLKITLESLNNQILRPRQITIITYKYHKTKTIDIAKLFDDIPISWRIEQIQDYNLTSYEMIDLIIPFVNADIYSIFHNGFIVPCDMFSELHNKIHNEFLSFALLLANNQGNGLTVVQKIHKIYQGNKDEPLVDKLGKDKWNLLPIHKILTSFPK